MKFNFLRHTSVQTFRIRKLNGGINMSDGPQNIADSQLSQSVNMWFSDGVLKTRPGICADKAAKISETANCNAAGRVIFGGEEYSVITSSEASGRFKVFFLSRKNTVEAGTICFQNQPENMFFYSAGEIFSVAVLDGKSVLYRFCADNKSWLPQEELKLPDNADNIIVSRKRVFLSAGSRLYAADLSAPCEFREICGVGNGEKITALLEYEKRLIIFKQNSMFIMEPDSGSIIPVSDSIGCVNSKTAVVCGEYPVWLNRNNEVCILIDRVIRAPFPLIGKLGQDKFALNLGGHYLLISGEKAVIMDFENPGSIKWHYWSFQGLRPLCGLPGENGMAVLSVGSNVCFSAYFSGETDTDISSSGAAICKKIRCGCTTKCFDFGISEKKYIENIFLSVAARGQIEVRINGRNSERVNLGLPDLDSGCGTFKSVRLIPHMHAVKSVYITLNSDDAFSLDEIMIYFRNAGL